MDCIPVLVSSGQRNSLLRAGDGYACIKGQFQSHNQYRQNRRRVMLSIFAQEVHFMTERVHELVGNRIYLKGHVCKDTVYRTTLRGLKITDILVAVNRPTGGSDYLPCISWGKYAIYASDLSVGDYIWLEGRIQSRDYSKVTSNGLIERRTAYEVSAFKIGHLDEAGHVQE